MSNLTNLAIAVQFTTETSTRPLHMLEIAQIALKERVKKWAAIITKPQPEPVVLFQAKCSIITAWKCLHRWSNLFPVCNYKDCLPVPYTVTLGENHNTLFFCFVFFSGKMLELYWTPFFFFLKERKTRALTWLPGCMPATKGSGAWKWPQRKDKVEIIGPVCSAIIKPIQHLQLELHHSMLRNKYTFS